MSDRAKVRLVEDRLKRKAYAEIEKALGDFDDELLIQLLDAKSVKVGDSAAYALSDRQSYPFVIASVLARRFATKVGKLRASNILFRAGRNYPEALAAHLELLKDSNDEVSDNSLLALVHWGDRTVIKNIHERKKNVKTERLRKQFELACKALEAHDPKSFDPNFCDAKGIWRHQGPLTEQ